MTIDTTSTQQMQQTQMRKMDGSGGGHGGGGGMKDVMQNLSSEDRVAVQEQMSALSQEDRINMQEQLKSVDSTTMTSDEYAQTLLDILDPQEDETSSSDTFKPVYA